MVSSASVPGKGSRRGDVPGWAELWQVPLFCLGLTSFLTVLLLRPADATELTSQRATYDKAQVALDQGELEAARRLVRALTSDTLRDPISEAEVRFLRGSLLLAEARKQFPLPLKNSEGQGQYHQVRTVLEEALAKSPKHPPPRLGYRLALARVGSEGLAPAVLTDLERTLEVNFTDRMDGFNLLVELRLALDPPDYQGAVRAIDQLLILPGIARPNQLRLRKAESLTELTKWADVQRVAAAIPAEAEEYTAALQLHAVAAFHQKEWGEAVRLFSLIPPRQFTPRSLLYLGMCHQKLKNVPEAVKAWERLWREHLQSPEAVRARVSLAELAYEQSNWEESVRSLAFVLTTQPHVGFKNPYLSADELRQRVISLGERLARLTRWRDLITLAEAAQSWELGGKAERWLALAWHAEARSGEPKLPAQIAHTRAADFAFRAAASLTGSEKQAMLYQAGQDSLAARAPQQAQRALGELLAIPPDPPLRPLVLIDLAEALYAQKQVPFACDRLREAIQLPGGHEAMARLRLAKILIQEKRLPEAELELEPAAELVTRPFAAAEAMEAAHLWALFLYHDVVVLRSSRALEAIKAGEKAVTYAGHHPLAAQTRYHLGELLLAQARPQRAKEPLTVVDKSVIERQAAQLWQAYQYFTSAAEDLPKPETEITGTMSRTDYVRYAQLGQADSLYYLGLVRVDANMPDAPKRDGCFQEAARLYQDAAYKLEQTADGLYSLLFLAQCQFHRGLYAEMSETIRNAYQQLERMTDAALAASVRLQPLTRREWETLLRSLEREDR